MGIILVVAMAGLGVGLTLMFCKTLDRCNKAAKDKQALVTEKAP